MLNTPTRRPKDRAKRLAIGLSRFRTFEPGEQAEYIGEAEVDIRNFPVCYTSLRLDKPGILLALPLGTPLPWLFFHYVSHDEQTDPFKNGANVARLGSINPYLTAQYLARIAYAYAVAEEGVGSFTPLVLDLITARTNYFRHWVGGELSILPPDPSVLHTISHSWVVVGGIPYLTVSLRLFCLLGTPTHYVVVGQAKGPLNYKHP